FTTIWYQQCLRNSSSLTDTFIYNLGAALTNFSTMAFQGISYSTASVGVDGEDPVYAVFQCRGDLKVSSCYACEQIAANRLTQACQNSVGARIQLDGCFLRYDNRSFFNLDTNAIMALCNVQNTSNITVLTAIDDVMGRVLSLAPAQEGFAYSLTASFSRNLNITLGNFFAMASQGTYYSTATADIFGTDPLYAVFQCRGDLTVETCYVCVQKAAALRDTCTKSVGARIQLDGCFLRYDNRSFFSLDTD
ncbi:hypothetical protein KP509_34G051800, partial [Ceratopteris richardii]